MTKYIRVPLTAEMEKDYRECAEMMDNGEEKDCKVCSMNGGSQFECMGEYPWRMDDGWIPVEERLPTRGECEKDNNEFLVQTNTGERFSCEYDPLANGFDNPLWCCNVPVVAWRPLPEPYREERREGE